MNKEKTVPGKGKISYTWGGHDGTYEVNLLVMPGISSVYVPVIYGLKSCYEAQQAVYRLNGALRLWAPELLREGAELPGTGHEYRPPTEAVAWHPQPKEGDVFPDFKNSYLEHPAPPRVPMKPHHRKPCSDCVNGCCDMNCGPVISKEEVK